MAATSSLQKTPIFKLSLWQAYARLPRREKRWHALVAFTLLGVVACCLPLPVLFYGGYGCGRPTFRVAEVNSLSPHTQVLFVGSSHFLAGTRPSLFKIPTAKLTTSALNYVSAEALVRRHLSRVPNVKIVVLEWDDVPLVVDTVSGLQNDYRPLMELGLNPWQIPVRDTGQRLRAMVNGTFYPVLTMPRLTPREWMDTQGCNSENSFEKVAAEGIEIPPRSAAENLKVAKNFYSDLSRMAQDADMLERNRSALFRTIALLRSRGIKVLLLRVPFHEIYWQHRPVIIENRMKQLHTQFQQSYGDDREVRICDLARHPGYKDGQFSDGFHLNGNGAARLARYLDIRLQSWAQGDAWKP